MRARLTALIVVATLAADRTLMAIIRTALSLISFGFTMYKVFQQLSSTHVLENANLTARRVGIGLIVMGTGLLAMGIWSHRNFALGLRAERKRLIGLGLMNEVGRYHTTPTFIVAAMLLAMGLLLLLSIAFRILE